MTLNIIASDTFTRVDLENEGAAFFFWMLVIILLLAVIFRIASEFINRK